MRIFVESSGWINLMVPERKHYTEAQNFFNQGLANDYKFFTSNIAIGYAVSTIKNELNAEVAFQFYDIVEEAHLGAYLRVLWIGRRTQKEALRLMRKYPKLPLGLYDFANVVLMNRRRIPTIFSFNTAYGELGLKVVPGGNWSL